MEYESRAGAHLPSLGIERPKGPKVPAQFCDRSRRLEIPNILVLINAAEDLDHIDLPDALDSPYCFARTILYNHKYWRGAKQNPPVFVLNSSTGWDGAEYWKFGPQE